ncbi:hypothetical protein Scep_018881 [Stephania cephalantha]|uniref:Uncharacterized protein n=1 Tax=Stephania cephalantha TaxID=152367 RepID=A0AAP0I9Y9_9MAGN
MSYKSVIDLDRIIQVHMEPLMNARLVVELGVGLEANRVKGCRGDGEEGRIAREEVAKVIREPPSRYYIAPQLRQRLCQCQRPFNNTAATAKRPLRQHHSQRPEEYQSPTFAAAKNCSATASASALFDNTTAVVEYQSPSLAAAKKLLHQRLADSFAPLPRSRSHRRRERSREWWSGVIGDGGRWSRKEAERGE